MAPPHADLQGHAERLFEAVDAVLAQAGVERASISGLACDVGPGSFTGVRVGVASAKGMALGLGLPLAGVVSLEAMAAAAFAAGAAGPGDVVVAGIDAKKGEVFVAAYGAGGEVLVAPSARPLGLEGFSLLAPFPRIVVVGQVAEGIAFPPDIRLARGPAFDAPPTRPGSAASPTAASPRRTAVTWSENRLYVRPPDITVSAHSPPRVGKTRAR